ncbi:MAG: cadherin repeat domain-containing protein, partial [Planctomycetaceae bacterium]|nr:cadherin repeat domain-containing protein [Planctomycetaceae bacterium]
DVPAQTLTYSITGGADSALFSIDATSGELAFISAPDFENPADADSDNVYVMQVTVTDSGTGNLADVQDIVVTVTDVNDNPVITSSNSVSAVENQTAVLTVTATDEDVPAQTLTYSISGGIDQALFSIEASSGELTFVSEPDFENPGDMGGDNVYDVQVTVTDSGAGHLTDVQNIAVTVTDVNDNPIITSSNAVNASENQSAVLAVTATDEDVPVQALTYSISGGADQALFAIDATSGELMFVAAPDFENPADVGGDNVYNVQLTVTDSGTVNLTDVQDIVVTVTDVNDAPAITSGGTVSASENQTTVITVVATDEDVPSQALTYSISGGADQALFTINATSGELTFVAAPNFEIPGDVGGDNVYNVQVTVSDSGVGNLTDVQSFVVTVTDVDELPVITGPSGESSNVRPTITWESFSGATSYDVFLSRFENTGTTVIVNTTSSQTSFPVTEDLGIGRYRAWVRATLPSGKTAWSSSNFQVSLKTTVLAPTPVAGNSRRPVISWNAVPGAQEYRVYVSNATAGGVVLDTTVTGTSFTPSADFAFGVHNIWVRAIGPQNYNAGWSTFRKFNVGPDIVSPIVATFSNRPQFSWTSLPNIGTYQLY